MAYQSHWIAERERIDLVAVATELLGRPPGRRGSQGSWWSCPLGTHRDANPSFRVDRGKDGRWRWRCFGCNEAGDAAALVRRVRGCSFPEAVAYLTGDRSTARRAGPAYRPPPAASPSPDRPAEAMGMAPEAAAGLVAESAGRLWGPEGAEARDYLAKDRGLAPEAIHNARLGIAPRIEARTLDGRPYVARGLVIPWFEGDRLVRISVRQPEGAEPRYRRVFDAGGPSVRLFLASGLVRPGIPLVLVEGELDALLMGQTLAATATVATLGSAGDCGRPTPAILGALAPAWPWFVAFDADDAGDNAAQPWLDRYPDARRVRPPSPFKDWSAATAGCAGCRSSGIDLARWWQDQLSGNDRPPLYTWDDLARWRWAGSADSDANLIVDQPDHAEAMRALAEALADEDDLERRAIRSEGAEG